MFQMQPIGVVRSPYTETAQIPKGKGAEHRAEGVLDILPQYEQGLMDVEGFSHLYVMWVFDRAGAAELIACPPSDDKPHGVFATRSPQRPNPIGLTVVALLGREGTRLRVRGIDMLDGTPILDIKPYLSSVPDAELRRGWLTGIEGGAPPTATTQARGTFEVKLTPQPMADAQEGLARLSLDKQFHGDLDATSQGEMLSAATSVKGSAGYVAIERVTGMLAGRRGTFVLQHTGTMDRGTPHLSITVVPDSGTGGLTGLSGTMSIDITSGQHSYVFQYVVS